MVPEQLTAEVQELQREGHSIKVKPEGGYANVVFSAYPVPSGFSKPSSSLLLRLPMSYPNGKPDMFWMDSDLTLEGGGIPKQARVIQTHVGQQWRRFSWHPQKWNPGQDNLRTYLEFVNARLAKAV